MSENPRKAQRASTIAKCYKVITGPALDLSMRELREFNEIKRDENKNKDEYERLVRAHGQENVIVNCLRLNNNKISTWTHFFSSIRSITDPSTIEWLDLSFNQLPTIDPVIQRLPNLKKLHLHANQISNINDVTRLVELPYLKDLTLHGNPIEDRGRGKYRNFIISLLPNLRSLDFTSLTERDKALAQSFCSNPTLRKTILTENEKEKKTPK